MLSEIEINLLELLTLQAKEDDMTLKEQARIKMDYNDMASNDIKSIRRDGKEIKLSKLQKDFINKVLPTLLKTNLPKLEEVLAIYDIKLTDTIYGDDGDSLRFGHMFD